jgi:putative DNA methylase
MEDYPRLIEHAFPLKQASLDSVHEKNVRHGHISTLHIWPARRPLAACRAALLSTLLQDPGTPEKRSELRDKIGGKVKKITEKGKERRVTEGGILHWKRETEEKELLNWFREEILKAYGGRAPKVLDPFAGGGAIPLEAMRLGCDVTASDLNPVAWFLLKCTLEHSQKLSGQKCPLPDFALKDRDFVELYLKKGLGMKGANLTKTLDALGHGKKGTAYHDEFDFEEAGDDAGVSFEAEFPWHIRAWGRWALAQARKELAVLYPTYADWQPLTFGEPFDPKPSRLLQPDADGNIDFENLNSELTEDYLNDNRQPRWVAKPTVAYLWARTVTCKNCRAEIPLLKTRWLCKKDNKRVRLVMSKRIDGSGVDFRIEENVPSKGGNAAQKRKHDKSLGEGTMSRSGATCPCCETIMTAADIRYEGRAGRLGQRMTTVITDGPSGKEYRRPTDHEQAAAEISEDRLGEAFVSIPDGVPEEQTPVGASRGGGGSAFSVAQFGLYRWRDLFTNRQLFSLGCLATAMRCVGADKADSFEGNVRNLLFVSFGKLLDYCSSLCTWHVTGEKMSHVFVRFALPITWDFAEVNPLSSSSGNYLACNEWVALFANHASAIQSGSAHVDHRSATVPRQLEYDLIITDPPYYDAIPYADLMDFFYVWLRRIGSGFGSEFDSVFTEKLSPKWNHTTNDGELIDDASRYDGDNSRSKKAYEDGMARAFQACHASLADHGRFVVVFAHKHPDAWETLVAAIIRSGFLVDASWPIATEMANRTRALSSAALASSVWLVCRKRDPKAKPGWDTRVLASMRDNISDQLREFWDAGIRGPDFVWAATGPAMEAYSQHPIVKKANDPGKFLEVHEFLEAVRRIVVEFVVGRVLQRNESGDSGAVAGQLDDVTSYYLLHRNDFGFEKAPAGACILYAVSCGLSDAELERTWNLIKVKGSSSKSTAGDDDENEEDSSDDQGSGSEYTLRTWKERKEKKMGFEAPGGREVPLIDRVHRLMHLWDEGDVVKVNHYIDDHALGRHETFHRLIQSLIELSRDQKTKDLSLLESLSNHLGMARSRKDAGTMPLALGD